MKKQRIRKKIIIALWFICFSILIFTSLLFYSIQKNHFNLYGELPSLEDLEKPKTDLSSELYSSDKILMGKYFRYNRTQIVFNDLSKELIETLLVTEDIRFYDHSGIDLRGLLRAGYGVFKNVFTLGSTKLEGGGSTITQQLAKNLFKTRKMKGKLSGVPIIGLGITKFKEWIVAIQLEKFYTKQEILAMLFEYRQNMEATHME